MKNKIRAAVAVLAGVFVGVILLDILGQLPGELSDVLLCKHNGLPIQIPEKIILFENIF
jgi:hypothetical protein